MTASGAGATKTTARSKQAARAPSPPKSELAYDAIRQRIANGTYGSGYRLVLDQLAQDLSISPVPVREAIRRLEAEGYVVFKHNVGAQVASIDVEEYAEVMAVLAVLESTATSLALPLLDADDIAAARALNEQMRASLTCFDPVGFTKRNAEFHEVLYAKCPNAHLRTFIAREWKRLDAIRRSTFSFVPERAQEAVKEHDQLLEMLETGVDAPEIERFCREHRSTTIAAFQQWHQAHANRTMPLHSSGETREST